MKTIFITGASKGIGKETALFFADNGWYVGITDIDEQGLADLDNELSDYPHFMKPMDVTDSDSVGKTISEFCGETDGKLNVLFNNAGIGWIEPFESIPLANHLSTVNVNVAGILNCTWSAFKYLKQTKNACVINMGSAAAHYGVPMESTYSGTKFFVKGFTEAMNLEWEPYGIHVCDIMPNFVNTPLMEDASHSILVKRVGIKLSAKDVVDVVWKAAHNNRIHWLVESFPLNIFQPFLQYVPRFVVRYIMKQLSGL